MAYSYRHTNLGTPHLYVYIENLDIILGLKEEFGNKFITKTEIGREASGTLYLFLVLLSIMHTPILIDPKSKMNTTMMLESSCQK